MDGRVGVAPRRRSVLQSIGTEVLDDYHTLVYDYKEVVVLHHTEQVILSPYKKVYPFLR